jgi:phosphatidylglycerol:prolipoprotein diacylglycerol transferase
MRATMYPEILRIPVLNLPIYGYGLMLVTGLLLAIELGRYLAKKYRLDPDVFSALGLIAVFSGIVGARVLFVIENWRQFFGGEMALGARLFEVVNISSGGLVYYGGVIAAVPAVLGYLLWKKVPVVRALDIIAPCLMIGLAFGRVGCYLNGCCWGKECELPVARALGEFPYGSPAYVAQSEAGLVTPPPELLRDLPDGTALAYTREEVRKMPALAKIASSHHSLPVHPTQLYSVVTALLLAGILVAFLTLGARAGMTFGLMLVLEGLTRTLIEALRINPTVFGPLSISMVIGLASAGVGVVVLVWGAFWGRRA